MIQRDQRTQSSWINCMPLKGGEPVMEGMEAGCVHMTSAPARWRGHNCAARNAVVALNPEQKFRRLRASTQRFSPRWVDAAKHRLGLGHGLQRDAIADAKKFVPTSPGLAGLRCALPRSPPAISFRTLRDGLSFGANDQPERGRVTKAFLREVGTRPRTDRAAPLHAPLSVDRRRCKRYLHGRHLAFAVATRTKTFALHRLTMVRRDPRNRRLHRQIRDFARPILTVAHRSSCRLPDCCRNDEMVICRTRFTSGDVREWHAFKQHCAFVILEGRSDPSEPGENRRRKVDGSFAALRSLGIAERENAVG